MRDPDYFVDSTTSSEFSSKLIGMLKPNSDFGFHLSRDDLKSFTSLPDNFNLPVQIMSGPPLTLRKSSVVPDHIRELVDRKVIQLFIHSPFVISPWLNYGSDNYVSRFYQNLGNIWRGVDVKGVVLHFGYNQNMSSLNESESRKVFSRDSCYIVDNLNQWQDSLGIPLLLENLVGSHKYSINPASIHSIVSLLNDGGLDSRIGICFDTEHSYASGDQVEDVISILRSLPTGLVRLCHCNSCPASVSHGSHIDLHSYTSIRESMGRIFSDNYWNLHDFMNTFRGIPKIFERSAYSVMLDDYQFMSSYNDTQGECL